MVTDRIYFPRNAKRCADPCEKVRLSMPEDAATDIDFGPVILDNLDKRAGAYIGRHGSVPIFSPRTLRSRCGIGRRRPDHDGRGLSPTAVGCTSVAKL